MKFSILMSVYNKESPDYLVECLKSIEGQTLKTDEVIMVEDGPLSPELRAVIEHFRDALNIVSVHLETNSGLAIALNEGLKHCKHELVARMDTDDIALPNRFEKQVKFMQETPSIAVCSAYIEEKDDHMEKTLSIRKLPVTHEQIVKFAKTRSPISHPVVMYRKSAIIAVNGYPNIYPEDYPLWCLLIAKGYIFYNIPEVLLYMRSGEKMISRRGYKFLNGYIQTYILMKRIGLINWFVLIRNIIIQSAVRLSPSSIRKLLYKYARG